MKNHSLCIFLFSSVYSSIINIPSDYSTIQAGIDASNQGDTILVAQGLYVENLYIDKEVLLGSNAIYDNLYDSWELNEHIVNTIISGYNHSTNQGGSCIKIANGNIQPTIKGFTFTEGRGSSVTEASCGPDEKISGGAILIYKAYPKINYNKFLNNGSSNSQEQYKIVNEGGSMVHYDDDDVEFDEDRGATSLQNIRTIPDTLDFRYNYFSKNYSSTGSCIFSDFEGVIDLSNSIFEHIDCSANGANRYMLGTKSETTTYVQNNVQGNCIGIDTVYVDVNGNDSNIGTYDHPLKTITYALKLNRDSSTTVIKVGPGLYSPSTNGETFPLVIKNNTHLIGFSKESTVLYAQGDYFNQRRVIEIYDGIAGVWVADNILIRDFTITGGYHIDDACIGGGGILIGDPVNFAMAGIPNVSPMPTLDNLIIQYNTSNVGGGIYSYSGNDFEISNSLINNNKQTTGGYVLASGVGLYGGNAIINRTIFTNNYTPDDFSMIFISGGEEVIYNGAAAIGTNSGNLLVTNSIFSENEYAIYNFIFNQANISIVNSIFYNNENTECYDQNAIYSLMELGGCNTTLEGAGNIETNPMFVDYENGDFNLQPNSPCIDAGTSDINGDGVSDILDYSGDSPDMGAFEWVELNIIDTDLPYYYSLYQNYPNPFNPLTTIKYLLPNESLVKITIYDMLGNTINNLVNKNQTSGYRTIQWDATNNEGQSVSAGVYLYSIQAGDFRQTKKMILLK
tara:strand:- start:2644 stop:4851 length:2208 start_codon:yes stop_codon:yes gene_type:complete